jgi:hypothetical protein
MKSIDLKMTSVEVKTETRPLRVKWTREMATDLQGMYGMDHVSKMETALMKEFNDIARTSSRRSKVCKIYGS